MHPNHRAIFTAISDHFQYDDSKVYVNASRRRSYFSALHASISVMKITEDFLSVLNVSTNAVDLLIPYQGQHIKVRRRSESTKIIDAIPQALTHIKYVGRRGSPSPKGERTVVGAYEIGHMVKTCMLFESERAVVTTAYFLRGRELRRLLRRKEIQPIFGKD